MTDDVCCPVETEGWEIADGSACSVYDKERTCFMRPSQERMGMMKELERDEDLDFLFKAILTLNTLEDCYHFFEDLCTVSELQEMSRRMKAAKMLKANHIYTEIAERTGLSTATISRVNRCLRYGTDGYLKALETLEKKERRGY